MQCDGPRTLEMAEKRMRSVSPPPPRADDPWRPWCVPLGLPQPPPPPQQQHPLESQKTSSARQDAPPEHTVNVPHLNPNGRNRSAKAKKRELLEVLWNYCREPVIDIPEGNTRNFRSLAACARAWVSRAALDLGILDLSCRAHSWRRSSLSCLAASSG